MATTPLEHARHHAVVVAEHHAHLLRVETLRQRGGTDDVTEEDRQMSAGPDELGRPRRGCTLAAQAGDGALKPATRADRVDADFAEIAAGQLMQRLEVNFGFCEHRRVLTETGSPSHADTLGSSTAPPLRLPQLDRSYR